MTTHIKDGQFQSDKYPTCPPGKVPLSVKDKDRGREDREALKLALTNARYTDGRLSNIIAVAEEARSATQQIINKLSALPEMPADIAPPTPAARAPALPQGSRPVAVSKAAPVGGSHRRLNGSSPAEGLSRPQQRILDALAWLEMVGINQADKVRVAMLADQSSKSSGYRANLSALSGKEMLAYVGDGDIALTDDGRAAANRPERPPTSAELQAAIRDRVQTKAEGPQAARRGPRRQRRVLAKPLRMTKRK